MVSFSGQRPGQAEGLGQRGDLAIRRALLEFREGPVEEAKEVVRGILEDRILFHPTERQRQRGAVVDPAESGDRAAALAAPAAPANSDPDP